MKRTNTIFFISAVFALAIMLFIALSSGPAHVHMWALHNAEHWNVIRTLRLPRIILALVLGCGLAVSGVSFQALLNNALADPYILGVAGGAALGSAFALWWRLSFPLVMASAFAASLFTMTAMVALAHRMREANTLYLLLTGAVCNAFAFACIMLIHAIVSAQQGQEILFVLMGSLAFAQGEMIFPVVVVVLLASGWLWWRARSLDALALGTDTAATVGLSVQRLQWEIFLAGSLIVGAVVASAGMVGFVGLFVPHAARALVGHTHRILIPFAALLGALVLLSADTLARVGVGGATWFTELPVGVITALVGAPTFLWILRSRVKRAV